MSNGKNRRASTRIKGKGNATVVLPASSTQAPNPPRYTRKKRDASRIESPSVQPHTILKLRIPPAAGKYPEAKPTAVPEPEEEEGDEDKKVEVDELEIDELQSSDDGETYMYISSTCYY